jgi:hypothetical protein
VTGKINITDCLWNLAEVVNDVEHTHFLLNNGTFESYKITVSSYDKSKLRFLDFDEGKNMSVNCSELFFQDIKTDLAKAHFTFFGGKSEFVDSV